MLLQYGTNETTWHMIDADRISHRYFGVEDEITSIKRRCGEDEEKLHKEIRNLFKRKLSEMGGFGGKIDEMHATKDWKDVWGIEIVVLWRENTRFEVFVFDYGYDFQIRYNDGTIIFKHEK